MSTLNLSTSVSGSGAFDHPALPGNAHGLVVVVDVPTHNFVISSGLSTQTNESLITLLTNDAVKTYINGFVNLPVGYTMEEYSLGITTDTNLAFKTYMDAYNASVSVDVTKVNLYVTYTINITKDDNSEYNQVISKIILFELE